MRPELHRLRGSQISEFLFALSMVKATHQLETCRTLAAQYVDSEAGCCAVLARKRCVSSRGGSFGEDGSARSPRVGRPKEVGGRWREA